MKKIGVRLSDFPKVAPFMNGRAAAQPHYDALRSQGPALRARVGWSACSAPSLPAAAWRTLESSTKPILD